MLALAAMTLLPATARAETILGQRIFVEFAFDLSTSELAAAERYGATYFTKAKAAGRPLTARVARSDSTILISLESVAICERAKGCPLLVFRDITKKPVLERFAFQNLILDYREKGTFLILRVWNTTTECLVSNVLRAKCKDVSPK
ncbi:hypothetical protein A6A04_07925 [Paramagnetospirillum marisnigri]|uniref:Uncharacterized protein n=2 Tax=Paramagnetospirillum marisnigri TaxID=1285242 RepID=A0A178MAD8_9PROT|nr:hypothetical protein A6A04_07925 [Paramagnetospirillum marisnigri]